MSGSGVSVNSGRVLTYINKYIFKKDKGSLILRPPLEYPSEGALGPWSHNDVVMSGHRSFRVSKALPSMG